MVNWKNVLCLLEGWSIENTLAVIAILISLITLIYAITQAARELRKNRKLKIFEFVVSQFDKQDCKEARTFLQKFNESTRSMNSNGITLVDYLNQNEEENARFYILEYLRSLDRIGNGLKSKVLDLELFFEIWQPSWVVSQWKILRTEVSSVESASGVRHYYKGFEWLVGTAINRLKNQESFQIRDSNNDIITDHKSNADSD